MVSRFLGVLAVWLLLTSLVWSPIASGQGDVEVFVLGVVERLKATLSYLESVNPAEAAKFREAFERAFAKLEEARVKAGADPSAVMVEVVKAQVEALNASRAVLARVNVTYPPGLLVALDVKLGMVVELNETIAYLKSANIDVEPWVEEKLRETARNIEALKEGLVSGALNASQVSVKLGEVNRNISEVRVYIAKAVKPGWLKARAASYVAGELVKSIRVADSIVKGNVEGVEELSQRLERLEKALVRLPELGIPGEELRDIAWCKIQIPGNETFIALSIITKVLKEISNDHVKARTLIAELVRCLRQPLERIELPGKVRAEAVEAVKLGKEVEEEARRQNMRALEGNPMAAIGLLRAEYESLGKLYEDYKKGEVGADEVRVQALIVLKLAEMAEQAVAKLPKPAQERLLETARESVSEANRILEEIGS